MKAVDLKSFIIGVLLALSVFLLMGQSAGGSGRYAFLAAGANIYRLDTGTGSVSTANANRAW